MPGPEKVISATGHRFVQLPDQSQPESLHGALEPILWRLATDQLEIAQPSHLITGGTIGFSLVITEAARALKIPYTLALPFKSYRKRWTDGPRDRLESLIEDAASVEYISSDGYSDYKMRRRDHWMIDHSDWVMALWSGRQGGTANAIMYAWSRRKQVKNIWPEFVKQASEKTL
ncbi:DUF1273 domain-containing protein [Mesorhizobium sp. M0955]|uniref:SLOG family protein n=1 Tax=Mesorhizobium sp. M0955 TaxID=2957033 RepID=UPI00333AF435